MAEYKKYIVVSTNNKVCKICGKEKLLDDFFKDVRYYKGVKNQCKLCYVEIRRETTKKYFERNKIIIYNKHKNYREYAKEKNLLKHKEWLNKNRERVRASDRFYSKSRKAKDLNYKLKCNLRTKISSEIKNNIKSDSTKNILGCSIEELKKYLESKFKYGMSWDNYGAKGWHIDHIIPCSSFDFSIKENQLKCFHYTNMQPLWAKDNIIKSNKIIQ